MTRIVIVGLGLIGGSLGQALRVRLPSAYVTGVDVAEVLRSPHTAHTAHATCDAADRTSVQAAAASADLVVLAAPVRVIAAQVAELLGCGTVVTDCGSTKRTIAAAARASLHAARFVPGHPMAGRSEGGLEAAQPDLFAGKTWILCPEASEPDAVSRVEELVRAVGAEPRRMSVAEHDRAVALTSHVPQLIASALYALAAERHALTASGPAFESATRVAGGAESMWRDIFETNADELSAALGALTAELEQARAALPDASLLLALLARARAGKARPRS